MEAVLGLQWGDEGKAKIIDWRSSGFDVTVRYAGGHNAGHTVVVGTLKRVFHILPSGCLRPDKEGVVAHGTVVAPEVLLDELAMLERQGIETDKSIRISRNAHLVMPYHILLDSMEEGGRGERRIGTTGRGIGPAYEDRAARRGLRVRDLLDPGYFESRLRANLDLKNFLLTGLYKQPPLPLKPILDQYLDYGRKLAPYLTDTTEFLQSRIGAGKRLLFEGAQGALLDVDLGTYPFVTSSHSTVGGIAIGTGVPFRPEGTVLGVSKAYGTRVGSGPFPTEADAKESEWLRQRGGEYGATTGRPRRCGWLDCVALRYAAEINDCHHLALTKVDVLSGIDKIPVCVGYSLAGTRLTRFPADANVLAACVPLYEQVPGWPDDLAAMPAERIVEATEPLRRLIQAQTGMTVTVLSYGPERDQTISLP
ncbi:adenylosuccinate synthase [bacterium]|nr:adenylosuccinate synthase [candidate division CSSED10-310 bacterium]